jgi:cation transport protein ChaC
LAAALASDPAASFSTRAAGASLGGTAAIIASGAGVIGIDREYLEQLAVQLHALEMEDPYVAQLYAHVSSVTVV